MRLRLIQTLHRRQSHSTDYTRIDYEDSEDESLPSSPQSSDPHHLNSSASNHHLRQSTSSLLSSSHS